MLEAVRAVPVWQPPLAEFDDLLRVTFSCEAPPHEILIFGHNYLLEQPPQEIVAEYADPARPYTLWGLADRFEEIYCGNLDDDRVRRLMEPLRRRLRQPLGDAIQEGNWRKHHPHLLESSAGLTCGRTVLRLYDSGKLPARIAAWDIKMARGIARRKVSAAVDALVELLTSREVQLHEAVAYMLRKVAQSTFHEISTRYARQPLCDVAKEVAERYQLCACLESAEMPTGVTALQDYETTRLTEDIMSWRSSMLKSIKRRL